MGEHQSIYTHIKRSSSMSYASRWKRENLRLISLVAFCSIAITFMLLLLLYGMAAKKVSLVVDGRENVIQTTTWNLQQLLDEQAISVAEDDHLSIPLEERIKDGDKIIIDHSVTVHVMKDGQPQTLYTKGKTVEDAIQNLNISLGEDDKVVPSMDTAISNNENILIVQVKKVIEEEIEKIPFETITEADPQLLKGKSKTVQEGVEGIVSKKIEKVYEDEVLVSVNPIEESVETERVNKVIALGTKKPVVVLSKSSPNVEEVTKKGLTFGVKETIEGVTLTAYAAGVSSTGKSKDSPGYGITYSGTKVEEGRTVAVDPKVIPLGWWIFIEGIGLRRAEDIGGAVKGKKVDVYYESEEYANKFGRKRGYTVYVIGPNKPKLN